MKSIGHLIVCVGLASLVPSLSQAEEPGTPVEIDQSSGGESHADLLKKLNNPISSLVSVPFQNNFDFGAGPTGDGSQWKMNFQPVIPTPINDDWNLITRMILPVISQEDVIGTTNQSGLSDTSLSLFFSPQEPTADGWIWGVGPVFLFPTATDDFLGTEQFSAGPTGVVLKQEGGWTYGALVSQAWSYAGDDARSDVNATYCQPFLSYSTPSHTTFGLNSETTRNWENHTWTVPINATVSQLVQINGRPIQFQFGGRWYPEAPVNGPEWGLRFTVTALFPKGKQSGAPVSGKAVK